MSAASTGEGLTAHSEPARLIPGSPGGLRATASGWRRTAGDVRDAGARVGRLRQIDDWSGEAAQTYEARLHSIRGAWIALETALRAGAVAVEAFADALTAARATAGDAVSLWQRAEQEAAVLPSTTAFVHSSTTPMHEDARAVLAQARATVDEAARVLADALASARSDPRLGTDAWTRLMHGDLTAARAMRLLGSGGADETRALLRAQPAAVAVVADADPEAIFSWWGGLTFAQREVLITDRPDLVGNLEGVPSAIRDRANRLVLDRRLRDTRREIDRLENSSHAVPHGTQSPAIEAAREQLRSLESIFLSARTPAGLAPRFILSLTDDVPPLAAVSVGDVDTADTVTFAVPGMGTTTAGMEDWTNAAQRLASEQDRLDPAHSHAVVAWIGYETPPANNPAVWGVEYAERGAPRLADALLGFSAVRPDAALNVVAHSYGTTTASLALVEGDVWVDSYVLVASAGLHPTVAHASDISAAHVYAAQAQDVALVDPAPGDRWAWVGRPSQEHPVNPMSSDFGSIRFSVDGRDGSGPVRDHSASTVDGGGYFDSGTESIRNIARATTGQGGSVSPYVAPSPTHLQRASQEDLFYGTP